MAVRPATRPCRLFPEPARVREYRPSQRGRFVPHEFPRAFLVSPHVVPLRAIRRSPPPSPASSTSSRGRRTRRWTRSDRARRERTARAPRRGERETEASRATSRGERAGPVRRDSRRAVTAALRTAPASTHPRRRDDETRPRDGFDASDENRCESSSGYLNSSPERGLGFTFFSSGCIEPQPFRDFHVQQARRFPVRGCLLVQHPLELKEHDSHLLKSKLTTFSLKPSRDALSPTRCRPPSPSSSVRATASCEPPSPPWPPPSSARCTP